MSSCNYFESYFYAKESKINIQTNLIRFMDLNDFKLFLIGRAKSINAIIGGIPFFLLVTTESFRPGFPDFLNSNTTALHAALIIIAVICFAAFLTVAIWAGILVWENYDFFLSRSFFYRHSESDAIAMRISLTFEFAALTGLIPVFLIIDILIGILWIL